MYTILRINNIPSNKLTALETRFRNLLPGHWEEVFFGRNERRDGDNTYVLSDKYFWADCQSDTIEILEILSPALVYANSLSADIMIDPAIFSVEYRDQKTIDVACSPELLKLLSLYNIRFKLSVYPTEWKCTELGDVFPPPVPPRPMNCIMYINHLLYAEEMFDRITERTGHAKGDESANSEDAFVNRHDNMLLLSKEIGWQANQDKIIEKLHVMSPALSSVSKQGASFSIDLPFDMNEYREYNLTCFSFADEFVKLLADFSIEASITIVMENVHD